MTANALQPADQIRNVLEHVRGSDPIEVGPNAVEANAFLQYEINILYELGAVSAHLGSQFFQPFGRQTVCKFNVPYVRSDKRLVKRPNLKTALRCWIIFDNRVA